jgi:phosphatidate cytidylyltransferase
MKNKEIIKRTITSLFLISLLILTFFYSYILLVCLILISTISWIEFNALISKIFNKKKFKINFLKLSLKALSLIYLTFFSALVFEGITTINTKIYTIFLFSICICSDIGGLIFGKIFKGKKLTKISPNKTISGSVGSFILSLLLVPFFYYIFEHTYNLLLLIIIIITVSFACQLGDLFISYLKRKAKVKDTGDLLPGHGGVLDRIDGMLFALPIGFITLLILKI